MLRAEKPLLVFLLLCVVSSSFPVRNLQVSQATFQKLNSSSPGRDITATSALLPELQKFFRGVEASVEVVAGDVVIDTSFPDTQIDDDCHHKIEAEHPKAE